MYASETRSVRVGLEPLVALEMACNKGLIGTSLSPDDCGVLGRGPFTSASLSPMAEVLSRQGMGQSWTGHISEFFTAKVLGNFSVIHESLWEGYDPLPVPWSSCHP